MHANLLKTVHTWNWAGVIFSFVFLLGRCHGVRSLFRKLNTALKLENAKAKNTITQQGNKLIDFYLVLKKTHNNTCNW